MHNPPQTADQDMNTYLARFDARHANDTYTCGPRTPLARLLAAYNRYLDETITATDGIPDLLGFEEWKASRTTVVPPTPEYRTQGNTLRPRLREPRESISFKVNPGNRPGY
ncbi:hypothetical protein ACWD25_13385 [Streptomyces sp. NPDC002920]